MAARNDRFGLCSGRVTVIIGFIGDVHALAAVATCQVVMGRKFDLLIQVGDMGAYPDESSLDPATNRYVAADPAQADFARLLRVDGARADKLHRIRAELPTPINFVWGNHEDFDWLYGLPVDEHTGTAPVDAFDILRYVPDGSVLRYGELRIAFLGGVEERSDERGIDHEAYDSLMDAGASVIDILVTHEGPYGTSIGYRGDVHGSHMMTRLIEHIRPAFHVAGHAHQVSGPTEFGPTTYLGLDCLVASPIWHPEARGLQQGCLGILDTEAGACPR